MALPQRQPCLSKGQCASRSGIKCSRPVLAVPHAAAAPNPAPSKDRRPAELAVILNDAKTNAFVEWCKQSLNVEVKGLIPATFNGIRGMAAGPSGIKKDQLIITIPRANAITLSPKQRCPAPDFIKPDFWKQQPWFCQIALILLYEKSRGSQSRLSKYIDQLPARFDHPVLWEDSRLGELLQYPHIVDKVREQRREWSELHRRLVSEGLAPGAPRVTQEEFMWALCAVRSRTFSGPYIGSTLNDRLRLGALVAVLVVANAGLALADVQRTASAAVAVFIFNLLYELILSRSLKTYAMCPLIDFINHSSQEQSEVSLDYFSDRYTVAAGKDYKEGEQVFISYGGNQTNDSLLQFYGFSEPDLADDCYVMTRMLTWLEKMRGPVAPARLQALKDAKLMEAVTQVAVVRKGFPAETLQALRYLLASDQEAGSKGVGGFQAAGSLESESQLAQVLVGACRLELEALGTTLEDDQAALTSAKGRGSSGKQGGGSSKGAEEEVALRFRIEKKKVLTAALQALGA